MARNPQQGLTEDQIGTSIYGETGGEEESDVDTTDSTDSDTGDQDTTDADSEDMSD